MKKTDENRYPHSATLFRFCKEALEIRYEGNVKVIDQDVGAILGYDPADCSHWKKGKKNIRALSTLKSIADHLKIDERLLIDIASGNIGLEEAVFEFKGYGEFSLGGRSLDGMKKDYFKNPGKWQSEGTAGNFEEMFTVDRDAISKCVDAIMELGAFTEAPIYIPEVFRLFPGIRVEANEMQQEAIVVEEGESVTTVRYKGPEMRPYMRFLLAKELFKYLVKTSHSVTTGIKSSPEQILDIQANIFAGLLLVPNKMIKTEVDRVDSSLDLVMQLANIFWVSKAFMNQRLSEFLALNN